MSSKTNNLYRSLYLCIGLPIIISILAISSNIYSEECSGWAAGTQGLAISPDGAKAYIAFNLDDSVMIVDLTNFTVSGCVDISGAGVLLGSTIARCTPDGKYVVVGNTGTENTMIINTETNSLEMVFQIKPDYGDSIKISDNSKLAFICSDASVNVINLEDMTTDVLSGVNGESICISPVDDSILFVIGGDDKNRKFIEYDLQSKQKIKEINLPYEEIPNDTAVSRFLIDPTDSIAYFSWIKIVENRGVGKIVAFDIDSSTIISTSDIDNGVADMVYNSFDKKIYTVGFWSGGTQPGYLDMSVWDTLTYEVERQIRIQESSDQRAIAIDTNNQTNLFLLEGDLNYLSKININTGQEIDRVELSKKGTLQPLRIIEGGNTGYIICQSSPVLFKIDLQSGDMIGNIGLIGPLSGATAGAYFNDKLYLVKDNVIYKVSPDDGSIIDSYNIPFDFFPIEMFFFNNRMVTINYEPGTHNGKSLLLFDSESMELLHHKELSNNFYGENIAITPDGSTLYIVSGDLDGPSSIHIIDGNNLAIIDSIDIPERGASSSDFYFDMTNRLLYILGFDSVFVIDMDQNQLSTILRLEDVNTLINQPNSPVATGLTGITVSEDNSELFVISFDTHSMYIYDLVKFEWLPKIVDLQGYTPYGAVSSLDNSHFFTLSSYQDLLIKVNKENQEVVNSTKIIYQPENELPGKASLISPAGTAADNSIVFIWKEEEYASWYKIYISDTQGGVIFSGWYDAQDVCSGSNCTTSPGVVFQTGSYEWWVKSWCDNGSVWSDGTQFSLQTDVTLPSKVTLVSPDSTTQDTSFVFTWFSDPASTWYKLWIGDVADVRRYATWYEASEICSDLSCTLELTTPLGAGQYNWYVKSWNEYGKIWSDGMSFSVSD